LGTMKPHSSTSTSILWVHTFFITRFLEHHTFFSLKLSLVQILRIRELWILRVQANSHLHWSLGFLKIVGSQTLKACFWKQFSVFKSRKLKNLFGSRVFKNSFREQFLFLSI
jgi:hypothetical protein